MRIAVIGAGVSGLFAAYELGRAGHEVMVISRDIGGLVRSHTNKGFRFDQGGHVYNVRSPHIYGWMPHLKGAVVHDHRKAIYVAHDTTGYATNIVDYPVQASAAKMGLLMRSDSDSTYQHQSLEDWAIGAFGEGFYHYWFKPFNERVWSTKATEMDSDWIASRVQTPKEITTSPMQWGPNSSFVYAPGDSIIAYLEAMAQSVGVFFFNASASITRAAVDNKILTTRAGQFEFDTVVSTLPLQSTLNNLRIELGGITLAANVVFTVGLGFQGELGLDFHWCYNDVNFESHRITNLAKYSPTNAPIGCDSLLIEIPMSNFKAHGPLISTLVSHLKTTDWPQVVDDSLGRKEIEMVLRDAGMAPTISTRLPVIANSLLGFTGYPVPVLGARAAIRKAKAELLKHDVLSIGRWGSHGYFNLDHCAAEAALLPDIVDGKGDVDAYLGSSFYYG